MSVPITDNTEGFDLKKIRSSIVAKTTCRLVRKSTQCDQHYTPGYTLPKSLYLLFHAQDPSSKVSSKLTCKEIKTLMGLKLYLSNKAKNSNQEEKRHPVQLAGNNKGGVGCYHPTSFQITWRSLTLWKGTHPVVETTTHKVENAVKEWRGCARFPIARNEVSKINTGLIKAEE